MSKELRMRDILVAENEKRLLNDDTDVKSLSMRDILEREQLKSIEKAKESMPKVTVAAPSTSVSTGSEFNEARALREDKYATKNDKATAEPTKVTAFDAVKNPSVQTPSQFNPVKAEREDKYASATIKGAPVSENKPIAPASTTSVSTGSEFNEARALREEKYAAENIKGDNSGLDDTIKRGEKIIEKTVLQSNLDDIESQIINLYSGILDKQSEMNRANNKAARSNEKAKYSADDKKRIISDMEASAKELEKLYVQKFNEYIKTLSDDEFDNFCNDFKSDDWSINVIPNKGEKYIHNTKNDVLEMEKYRRDYEVPFSNLPDEIKDVLKSAAISYDASNSYGGGSGWYETFRYYDFLKKAKKMLKETGYTYDSETIDEFVSIAGRISGEEAVKYLETELDDASTGELIAYNVGGILGAIYFSLPAFVQNEADNFASEHIKYRPVNTSSLLDMPVHFHRETKKETDERITEPVANFFYNAGMTLGEVGAASLAGSQMSLLLMSGYAGSNAIYDAKEQGATDAQAADYGLMVFGASLATERMFGGLAGTGTGLLDDVGNTLIKNIKNPVFRGAFKTVGTVGGEIVEEEIQYILDIKAQQVTFNPDATVDLGDMAYTGLLSAVVSLPGGTFKGIKTARMTKATYDVAKEIADKASKVTTPQEARAMLMFVDGLSNAEDAIVNDIDKLSAKDITRKYGVTKDQIPAFRNDAEIMGALMRDLATVLAEQQYNLILDNADSSIASEHERVAINNIAALVNSGNTDAAVTAINAEIAANNNSMSDIASMHSLSDEAKTEYVRLLTERNNAWGEIVKMISEGRLDELSGILAGVTNDAGASMNVSDDSKRGTNAPVKNTPETVPASQFNPTKAEREDARATKDIRGTDGAVNDVEDDTTPDANKDLQNGTGSDIIETDNTNEVIEYGEEETNTGRGPQSGVGKGNASGETLDNGEGRSEMALTQESQTVSGNEPKGYDSGPDVLTVDTRGRGALQNGAYQSTGDEPGGVLRRTEDKTIEEIYENDDFINLERFVGNEISNGLLKELQSKYFSNAHNNNNYEFMDVVVYDMLTDADNELRGLFGDNIAEYFNTDNSSDTDITGTVLSSDVINKTTDSVVKNAKGQLIPVYHSTNTEFDVYKPGDIGVHFGSLPQAQKRASDNGYTKPIIKKAYLNITKPLYIEEDFMGWHADQIAQRLGEMGIISQEDAERFFAAGESVRAQNDAELASIIQGMDYDGIIYDNDKEALNGRSYIVFDNSQIIPADTVPRNRDAEVSTEGTKELNQYEKLDRYGLTYDEQYAVMEYKGSASYLINDYLYNGGTFTPETAKLVDDLNSALDKMPTYSGTVYRNIGFDDQSDFDDFVNDHTDVSDVVYPAFTSASKTVDGYPVETEYKVHYAIKSENAKDTADIGLTEENEVIFKSGTKFNIIRTRLDGNTFYIICEEAVTNDITEANDNTRYENRNIPGDQEQTVQSISEEYDVRHSSVQRGSDGAARVSEEESGSSRRGSNEKALLDNGQYESETGDKRVSEGQVLPADRNEKLSENERGGEAGELAVSATPDESMSVSELRDKLASGETYGKFTKAMADAFYKIAKAFGVDIIIDRANGGLGYDGYFDKANRAIHVNADAVKPLDIVLRHEVIHFFKSVSPLDFEVFAGLIKERYISLYGEEAYNKYVLDKREEYKARTGEEIGEETALEELCADEGMDMLARPDDVRKFVTKNRGVIKRFFDCIKRVLQRLGRALGIRGIESYSVSEAYTALSKAANGPAVSMDTRGRMVRNYSDVTFADSERGVRSTLPNEFDLTSFEAASRMLGIALDSIRDAERASYSALQSIREKDIGVAEKKAEYESVFDDNLKAEMDKRGADEYSDSENDDDWVFSFNNVDNESEVGYNVSDNTTKGGANVGEENNNIGRISGISEESRNQRRGDRSDKQDVSGFDSENEIQNRGREQIEDGQRSKADHTGLMAGDVASNATDVVHQRTEADSRRYAEAVENGNTQLARSILDAYAVKNGYTPVNVYHGTHSDNVFTVFENNGAAHWVSTEFERSDGFSEGYYGSDPKAEQLFTSSNSGVYDLYVKRENTLDVGNIDIEISSFQQLFDFAEMIGFSKQEIKTVWNNRFEPGINEMWTMTITPEFADIARKHGFDSLSAIEDGNVRTYGILYPENIKSSKLVTYDDKGNIVPLDKRFDTGNNDIRYSFSNDYIPKGEKPARDIAVPAHDDKGRPVSRGIRTILEAEATPETYVSGVLREIREGNFSRQVITDKAALKRATDTMSKRSYISVFEELVGMSERGKMLDKYDIALLQTLYNESGEHIEFLTQSDSSGVTNIDKLLSALVNTGRVAGQNLQAQRMLKLMTPMGLLYNTKSLVDDLNARITEELGEFVSDTNKRIVDDVKKKGRKKYNPKQKPLVINAELQKQLLDAKTLEDAQRINDAILADLGDQVLGTWIDKVRKLRYFGMLSGPRTHVRNMAGNSLNKVQISMADSVSAMLQRLFIKDPQKRTKALVGIKRKNHERYKALRAYARELFGTYADYVKGDSNRYDMQTYANDAFENARHAFNSKLGRMFEKIVDFNSDMLEREDMLFLKPAFEKAFAKVAFARGYTVSDLTSGKVSAEEIKSMIDIASKAAQEATFREASWIATKLNEIEKKNAFTELAVGTIIPFKKTPVNILKTGTRYSPAGLILFCGKVVGQTYDRIRGKRTSFDGVDLIDTASKGLVGTGVFLIGALFGALGLLTGGEDEDDKLEALEDARGHQNYALEIGNFSITLDWMTPVNMPLFAGVAFNKAVEDGGLEFDDIVPVLSDTINPVLEASLLSGTFDTIRAIRTAESDSDIVTAFIEHITASYGLSFFPQLIAAAAKTIDSVDSRTTADAGMSKFERFWRRQVANKLPFLRDINKPYTDRWGGYDKKDSPLDYIGSFLQNFVIPGYVSQISDTNTTAHLSDLYEKTGSTDFIPTYVKSFSVNKQTKKLTQDEIYEYQIRRGELWESTITELMQDDIYMGLSSDKQAYIMCELCELIEVICKYECDKRYNVSKKKHRAVIDEGSTTEAIIDYLKGTLDDYQPNLFERYPVVGNARNVTAAGKRRFFEE